MSVKNFLAALGLVLSVGAFSPRAFAQDPPIGEWVPESARMRCWEPLPETNGIVFKVEANRLRVWAPVLLDEAGRMVGFENRVVSSRIKRKQIRFQSTAVLPDLGGDEDFQTQIELKGKISILSATHATLTATARVAPVGAPEKREEKSIKLECEILPKAP